MKERRQEGRKKRKKVRGKRKEWLDVNCKDSLLKRKFKQQKGENSILERSSLQPQQKGNVII